MMRLTITIDVEIERTSGKFVSKDAAFETIQEESLIEPGTLYIDESEYEVTTWDVSY